MSKRTRGKRQKPFDVTIPDTLHDQILEDLNRFLDTCQATFSDRDIFRDGNVPGFKVDWLRKNLLSKFQDRSTTSPRMRKAAAIEKWLAMEKRNRSTNTRLRFMEADFGPFTSEQVFSTAARFVAQTIGSRPVQGPDGHFTNGASTRVKRGSTAIAHKYTGNLHASVEAWYVFTGYAIENSPLWTSLIDTGVCSLEVREASDMFTVPKASTIDRVACKEPEINMFLQRGVGDYFRAMLRKRGCNLNDQSVNRGLARRGSCNGVNPLATLDLSSASDLISTSLVYRLLPLEWVLYLETIRVKSTMINGKEHQLEMFSSMGNGFTFELESLIFLSLARAVCYLTRTKGRVSVFGDDIIIPCSAVGIFTKVLQFCGCIVNPTKSFSKGWFRESCGGHYYAGNDVTPFYVRSRINTLPKLILFLNQFRVWACDQDACISYWSLKAKCLWDKYASYVPSFLWGGTEMGADYALMSPHRPRKRLGRVQRRLEAPQLGALLYWLHRRPDCDSDEPFETSYGVIDGDYVIRRNRTWDSGIPLNHMWYEEIV